MKLPKSLEIKCQEKAEKFANPAGLQGLRNPVRLMMNRDAEAFNAGCATGFELTAQLSQPLVEALQAWYDWEQGQIAKEGAYCGKRINELIAQAGVALAEYKKAMED